MSINTQIEINRSNERSIVVDFFFKHFKYNQSHIYINLHLPPCLTGTMFKIWLLHIKMEQRGAKSCGLDSK